MENNTNSWLADFAEYTQKTALPTISTVGDNTFAFFADGTIKQIEPERYRPGTLPLNSLDSLVKLVKTELIPSEEGYIYITVPSHLKVLCFVSPDYGTDCFRKICYEVNATDVPGWGDGVKMGFEEMQIALRTRFQPTPDADYVMRLLSEISNGSKITYNDNGIATTIVTSKGVALQGKDTIRPIVTLKPYRTFQEIEQPESTFLIRVSERGISFTEADGGMWKLKARQTVKAFLEENFQGCDDRVIVAL